MSPWRGWLLAVLVLLTGGCKRQEPAVSPTVPTAIAPAPAVPPQETFALSNLQLRYDEKSGRLDVSYAVRNRSGAYANASLCFDLLDKDGYFIREQLDMDSIGLSAGDSEEVNDVVSFIPREQWSVTTALRVYLSHQMCHHHDFRAAVLFVDPTGRALKAGGGTPFMNTSSEADDPYAPSFELKDARLVQNDLDEVMLSYTLTNVIKGRASGQLCVRLIREPDCPCQGLDSMETEEFDMGLAASKRHTLKLDMRDPENWARAQWLVLYMASSGCMDSPDEAVSNVLTLARPRSIHVPVPREPEPVDQDD